MNRAPLHERFTCTLNPSVLTSEIARASAAGDLDRIELDSVATRALTFRRDRFVVLVDIRSPEVGSIELVAKGFKEGRARKVLNNHEQIWKAGLGAEAKIRTSRPWGLLDSLEVILMERLPGAKPGLTDVKAAARMAEATARLHGCSASVEPRLDLRAVLDKVLRRAARIESHEPRLAEGAGAAAELACSLAETIEVGQKVPSHGDLARSAFLLDGDNTYLIDWDASCRFDGAWDVAYYLVQQRRRALQKGVDTAPPRERFLQTYLEARGDGDLGRRVAYFEALVSLMKLETALKKARTALSEGRQGSESVVPELISFSVARLQKLN